MNNEQTILKAEKWLKTQKEANWEKRNRILVEKEMIKELKRILKDPRE